MRILEAFAASACVFALRAAAAVVVAVPVGEDAPVAVERPVEANELEKRSVTKQGPEVAAISTGQSTPYVFELQTFEDSTTTSTTTITFMSASTTSTTTVYLVDESTGSVGDASSAATRSSTQANVHNVQTLLTTTGPSSTAAAVKAIGDDITTTTIEKTTVITVVKQEIITHYVQAATNEQKRTVGEPTTQLDKPQPLPYPVLPPSSVLNGHEPGVDLNSTYCALHRTQQACVDGSRILHPPAKRALKTDFVIETSETTLTAPVATSTVTVAGKPPLPTTGTTYVTLSMQSYKGIEALDTNVHLGAYLPETTKGVLITTVTQVETIHLGSATTILHKGHVSGLETGHGPVVITTYLSINISTFIATGLSSFTQSCNTTTAPVSTNNKTESFSSTFTTTSEVTRTGPDETLGGFTEAVTSTIGAASGQAVEAGGSQLPLVMAVAMGACFALALLL